jgi:hypothetical protein
MIAEVLCANGFQATWTDKVRFPNPFRLRKFDLVYGIYLQTCRRHVIVGKLLGKKTLIHFVGSDAYRIARERSIWRRLHWRAVLWLTDLVLYVSPHLQSYVKRQGFILPFPINTSEFQSQHLRQVYPDRDILYYCPGGARNSEIYRLSWIIDYAQQHADEKITILGNRSCPAQYEIDLSNISVVPYVEREEMPVFYRRHKKLIRMTTEDGLPRMLSEALLCGLQVIFNGEEVKHIPPERDPREFARSFRRILDSSNLGKHDAATHVGDSN